MATQATITERRLAHVDRARHHAAADMLISGTYGDDNSGVFRACSVGCFAHDIRPAANKNNDNLHVIVADEIGAPEWIVRWQDAVFEGLPQADRASFHVGLAERIALLPESFDFDRILHKTAIARMDRLIAQQEAAKPQQPYHAQVIAALRQVRAYNENPNEGARSAARSAAESAWSAAESAAWSARSARSAAWSAAESARSAAESAARSAEYQSERDAMFAALESEAVSP